MNRHRPRPKKQREQVLRENLFIAGGTGTGKSYYFEHNILPILLKHDWRQIIILDMKNEYNLGVIVDLNKIESALHLAEIMVGKFSKDRPPRIVVIKCTDFTPKQIEQIVMKYLILSRNKILVHEEGSFYYEDLKTKRPPFVTKKVFRSCTLAHNNNHNIIIITQQPNDVPKSILGQCQRGIIFRLEEYQLKYLYSSSFLPHKPEHYDFSRKYTFYEVPDRDQEQEQGLDSE